MAAFEADCHLNDTNLPPLYILSNLSDINQCLKNVMKTNCDLKQEIKNIRQESVELLESVEILLNTFRQRNIILCGLIDSEHENEILLQIEVEDIILKVTSNKNIKIDCVQRLGTYDSRFSRLVRVVFKSVEDKTIVFNSRNKLDFPYRITEDAAFGNGNDLESVGGTVGTSSIFNFFVEFEEFDKKFGLNKKDVEVNTSKQLGRGAFGTVYNGSAKGLPVAIKKPQLSCSRRAVRSLIEELKVHSHLGSSRYVVKFIGAYIKEIQNDIIYIVLELCEVGSLKDFLTKKKEVQMIQGYIKGEIYLEQDKKVYWQELMRFVIEIGKGLQFIGSQKVVHGDLSARNVLLDSKFCCKICDFGLSRILNDNPNFVDVSEELMLKPWKWMAYEALAKKELSYASDIWSFGVTVWEIFSLGNIPYAGLAWSSTFQEDLKNGLRLQRAQFASEEIHSKLMDCWMLDPKERPSILNVISFFENICMEDYSEEHRQLMANEFEGIRLLIENLSTSNSEIESELKELRKENKKLKDIVEIVLKESTERNLIIRGLSDFDNESSKSLLQSVNKLFIKITKRRNIKVEAVYRLGQYESGFTRQVRVVLCTRRDRNIVFSNRNKLDLSLVIDVDSVSSTSTIRDLAVSLPGPHTETPFLSELSKDEIVFDTKDLLGRGSFGIVYKGTVGGLQVAVKVSTEEQSSTYGFRSMLKEIKVNCYIGSHPNLVQFIGAYTKEIEKGILIVVTELCPNGSLQEFLRKKYSKAYSGGSIHGSEYVFEGENKVIFNKLIRFSLEISKAMEHLAVLKVVHGDVALRNVYLDSSFTCKLGDFILSRKLYEYAKYVKTTQEPLPWRWLAYETLVQMEFSLKSDMWSFGVTLWEIFSLGEPPFKEMSWTVSFADDLRNGLRLPEPAYIPIEIYSKMKDCWDLDAERRPNPTEMVDFFTHYINKDYNVDFPSAQMKTDYVNL